MQALWRDLRRIIDHYNGGRPLADYLRAYFKANHRLGSRDRKMLAECSFAWYRAATGFAEDLPFEQKMQACIALCGGDDRLSRLLSSPLSDVTAVPAAGRRAALEKLGYPFSIPQPDGFPVALSEGITREHWLSSMLTQPRLFARLRRPAAVLLPVLDRASVRYELLTPTCIALPAGTPLQNYWSLRDYTVQDASSQATGDFFGAAAGESWWDCCAGGGGKSLMLADSAPAVRLTASDIRSSALQTLQERFAESGAASPMVLPLDAADSTAVNAALGGHLFNAAICDVPCSGSGTWARTPEAAYFFNPAVLDALAPKQAAILGNAARRVKSGGKIIYITCSVFRQENESVVEAVLASATDLKLAAANLINGTAQQADSLYVAVLRKAG